MYDTRARFQIQLRTPPLNTDCNAEPVLSSYQQIAPSELRAGIKMTTSNIAGCSTILVLYSLGWLAGCWLAGWLVASHTENYNSLYQILSKNFSVKKIAF